MDAIATLTPTALKAVGFFLGGGRLQPPGLWALLKVIFSILSIDFHSLSADSFCGRASKTHYTLQSKEEKLSKSRVRVTFFPRSHFLGSTEIWHLRDAERTPFPPPPLRSRQCHSCSGASLAHTKRDAIVSGRSFTQVSFASSFSQGFSFWQGDL